MRSLSILSLMACIVALPLCSCHTRGPAPFVEEPEDECLTGISARHTVMVELAVDESMPDNMAVEYPVSRASYGWQRRYVVNVYRQGSRQLVASATSLEPVVPMELPVGKLEFVAWADNVPVGNMADHYWFTDDFSEILLYTKRPYSANDGMKPGYLGAMSMVMPYNLRNVTLPMSTVMGQIRLIATDTRRGDVDRITVSYPGTVPAAIDAFSGRVCREWEEVEFETTATQGGDGWLIAYDYIPAETSEITVPVGVTIHDAAGEVVACIKHIDVPVRRGCVTEVRAPFFSLMERDDSGNNGGISIDTGYTDDIVIEIK